MTAEVVRLAPARRRLRAGDLYVESFPGHAEMLNEITRNDVAIWALKARRVSLIAAYRRAITRAREERPAP